MLSLFRILGNRICECIRAQLIFKLNFPCSIFDTQDFTNSQHNKVDSETITTRELFSIIHSYPSNTVQSASRHVLLASIHFDFIPSTNASLQSLKNHSCQLPDYSESAYSNRPGLEFRYSFLSCSQHLAIS